MPTRIVTQNNYVVFQDTAPAAGQNPEITRIKRSEGDYTPFPDITTPANDYVTFHKSDGTDFNRGLRNSQRILRTDLVNGDLADAPFANIGDLNTFLSALFT